MSSKYDLRMRQRFFLNFKLFWWILAIGWYVIIVVYHYVDDGCVFREANSHFMNHYYRKHYMAIIFSAKMSLIEINLAGDVSRGFAKLVYRYGRPNSVPKKFFQVTLFLMEYFGLIFLSIKCGWMWIVR